jgi:hypothetical protein
VGYSAACYSSDYTYGYSANAAAGGTHWSMSQPVLGVEPVQGLDITGVLYRYTAVKERPDDFSVTVQNENAIDGGYIFRSTDDWSGKSGQTINKLVPIEYSPIKYWGNGSIETEGVGSVEDPVVLYTYRFKPPEPEIPEIPAVPLIDVYSVFDDEAVQRATAETDLSLIEKDEDERKEEKDDEHDGDLEKALAASENALTMAGEMSQAALLRAMNPVTMTNYYAASIPGGAYKETVILVDRNLPDNRRAFRSMANDRLHNQLVEDQYK